MALRRVVLPSLLYGMGALNLTQKQLQRIRATENNMMRRILRMAPDPEDGSGDYMATTNAAIQAFRVKFGLLRWDKEAWGRVYEWAGHVARFGHWAADRLAWRVLKFRDSQYLSKVKAIYGTQCHGKRFHCWRWEQQLSQFLGPEWGQTARDEEGWRDAKTDWLTQRAAYNKP